MQSVLNLNNKRTIIPKQYEIGCQLLLISNRKSHTGFRLIPTSITLNDLERRNSPYFAFFSPKSITRMIIIAVKRILNSDKICHSYSDLNFGVTFFGTQCI